MKSWALLLVLATIWTDIAWTAEAEKPTPKAWWLVPDVSAQPSDKIETYALGKPFNLSLDERQRDAAEVVLMDLRFEWSKKTPDELIGLICDRPEEELDGVSAIVANQGNQLIFEELLKRGSAAREVLQSHTNDKRQTYGYVTTIGDMCEQLVGKTVKFNGRRPRAGDAVNEAEVAPGIFVKYQEFLIHWQFEDECFATVHGQPSEREKFYQKDTAYLCIPWQRKPILWVGLGVPITLRVWKDCLYLIAFDRETDFGHIRFRYYRQNDKTFMEIPADQFPKSIATQNLWLKKDNGTRNDGSTVNEIEIAKEMNPADHDFQDSLTAKLWYQCETGKEYYEMPSPIDEGLLKTYREKYDVVKLKEIQREHIESR